MLTGATLSQEAVIPGNKLTESFYGLVDLLAYPTRRFGISFPTIDCPVDDVRKSVYTSLAGGELANCDPSLLYQFVEDEFVHNNDPNLYDYARYIAAQHFIYTIFNFTGCVQIELPISGFSDSFDSFAVYEVACNCNNPKALSSSDRKTVVNSLNAKRRVFSDLYREEAEFLYKGNETLPNPRYKYYSAMLENIDKIQHTLYTKDS